MMNIEQWRVSSPRTWMRLMAVAVFLMPMLLAACGGASPAASPAEASSAPTLAPTPTPEPTPAPTPTPEPTPDLAALGEAYLTWVADFAAAQDVASKAIDAATNDQEASAGYQLFVDAFAGAMAPLQAIDFPKELWSDRDALIDAITTFKVVYGQLAGNPQDADPSIDLRLESARVKSLEAGSAIRAALGLPPPG